MKIMVVDNDVGILEVVQALLVEEGHEVECCDSAEKAREQLAKADHYDFVLVDYKMPEHDGIWFMENAELSSKTKVLLMTAYVSREVINRMFALGVCGYIIKPFDSDEILRHIDYHSGSKEPS